MVRFAAAGIALALAAMTPALAEDELLGGPGDAPRAAPKIVKPPPKTAAKPAAKPRVAAKPALPPAPRTKAAIVAKVEPVAPKPAIPKLAIPKPATIAKTEPPAPKQPASAKPPQSMVENVAPPAPPPVPKESASSEAPDSQDRTSVQESGAERGDDRSVGGDGQTASFFAAPSRNGDRVFVDSYSRRNPRWAAQAAADDFCRDLGFREGAYYAVAPTRDGLALQDVLCVH